MQSGLGLSGMAELNKCLCNSAKKNLLSSTIWILKMPPYRHYSVTMEILSFPFLFVYKFSHTFQACTVILPLSLMPKTAGMRLWRFTSEEMQKNMSENNNGSSIWNNLSCHFSLCNLDGGIKVLKLCGMWWKWSSKSKRLYKLLRVLSLDCIIIIILMKSNKIIIIIMALFCISTRWLFICKIHLLKNTSSN